MKIRNDFIKIRTKNKRPKKKIVQITTYSPYKIKCNNWNRQYIESRNNFHKSSQNYQSIETLITDFAKAKEHYECHFTQKKNKLIDTLKNKIKLIEDYYQKSLSYHQIVFKLIDKLITDYNRTKSVSIFQDLNNICNFDFPKMEEHKVSLDRKG